MPSPFTRYEFKYELESLVLLQDPKILVPPPPPETPCSSSDMKSWLQHCVPCLCCAYVRCNYCLFFLFIFFSDSSSASNQSSHPFAEPVDATNESLKKSVPENGENDGEYLSHPPDRRAESTSYSSNPMCGKRVDAKAKRLSSPESNPSLDVSVDVNSPREVVLMFNSDLRQAEISSPSSTCCEKMASMCSLKFKTQPILGTYATKRLFCSRAPSAKVVILNVPVESSSGSLMFKSSILTPEDVRNLRMTAALVVLPPCLSDDGLSKMTAAFLAAGAQSVLTCPQSAIISESHSTFFDYFINFLLSGDSSVCALRRAQISLHCILEFSDPIFWSDYRIVGRDVHIKVANPVDASALIKCIGLPGIASDQSCFVSIQKNIADSAETTNIHVSPILCTALRFIFTWVLQFKTTVLVCYNWL